MNVSQLDLTTNPLQWWWACEPVYVLSNMAIKASIAVMLLRLTVNATQRIILWVVLFITELYATVFFFLFIFQCRPSSYFWTQFTGGSGSCIDPTITVNAVYVYSAITCVGDWVLATLPFFLVWKLQINVRAKILVALISSDGYYVSLHQTVLYLLPPPCQPRKHKRIAELHTNPREQSVHSNNYPHPLRSYPL